jgi:formylglycine-generating enzyme required for sulfatase activity
MDAPPKLHPSDETLSSFGLGKLDDASAESVSKHLEECAECRKRVAEMPDDSFLGRFRGAQAAGPSMSKYSQPGETLNAKGTDAEALPAASTHPPGLAEHPDYDIKRELGRGGMGVVYLAHNKLMGRDEVLKVVSGQLVDRPVVLDRFLREIRSAAKMHHTNIVTAYSAIRAGESIVFAMEYVEGYDLAQLVKGNGPLPVAHACNFVHQAALGLQYAHEQGMVHRDIKPSNLILARQRKKPVVKVLDFGLAKVAIEGQGDTGLTREGQMLGTPDYIAPEQIRNAQSADIRADIYSLGCTLYYLLAGRAPFHGAALWDLYQAHFSMDASPLNLVRPEVPVELAALVAKMMAKDPERRFQQPKEVAQALEPFFKKGNVTVGGTRADISQMGVPETQQAEEGAVSIPTRPGAELAPARAGIRPEQSARPEPASESSVDLKKTESSPAAAPAVALKRRPPWLWPAAAASILLLALVAAWAAGVFKVKTASGVIVVENVPPDAVVEIDGGKVTITPSEGQPVRIEQPPGKYFVRVKRGGDELLGESVMIASGEQLKLRVRLEPLADAGRTKVAGEDGFKVQGQKVIVESGARKPLMVQLEPLETPQPGKDIDIKPSDARPNPSTSGSSKYLAPRETLVGERDRRAAEAALALGGSVTIHVNGQEQAIEPGNSLPAGTFQLTRVRLDDQANLTDAGLEPFARLTNLFEFRLGKSPLVKEGGVVHFRNLPRLEELWLNGSSVTDSGLEHLRTLPGLKVLHLNGTAVSDAGLVPLEALRQLDTLGLWATRVTDAGLVHVQQLTQLRALNLGATQVTDAGLVHLEPLTQLNFLSLEHTRVTDAGLVHLRGLTKLRDLRFSAAQVSGTGLVHLQNLRELGLVALSGMHVTDATLGHLASFPQLRYLWVGNARVTDEGLVHLQGLAHLIDLGLVKTQVTDAGLVHLQHLAELKRLNLKETNVTAAGLERLQKSLPACQILADPVAPQTSDGSSLAGPGNAAAATAETQAGKTDAYEHVGKGPARPGAKNASRSPSPGSITNSVGIKLVLIPSGEFLMGSPDSDRDAQPDEKPPHPVRFNRSFRLGATEVTQGQYRAVTGENPSSRKADRSDDLPVENVSWVSAIAFCNKLSAKEGLPPYYESKTGEPLGGDGYRLPTEAEWEYACRARSRFKFSFGDDETTVRDHGWFTGNFTGDWTHAVGQKLPNAFGLYDMHGNVWEWCWDKYDGRNYANESVDNRVRHAKSADRVSRGGCWNDAPHLLRAAYRGGPWRGDRAGTQGFRVARGESGQVRGMSLAVDKATTSAPDASVRVATKPAPESQPATAPPPADPEEVLKKHGLVLYGEWCILAEEAQVFESASQAQRYYMEWQLASMEADALLNADVVIPELEAWVNQYNSEIQNVNWTIGRLHGHARGKHGGGHAGIQMQAHPGLQMYKEALEQHVGQAKRVLANLKKQAFDPEAGPKIVQRIQDNRRKHEQKFTEFERLLDATRQKYKELFQNQEVKYALASLGKRFDVRFQLTASDEFKEFLQWMEGARKNNRRDGKEELRGENQPNGQDHAVLGELAPGFSTQTVGEGGLVVATDHFGRPRAFRTHPVNRDTPCIVSADVDVPAGKRTSLVLDVSHHPKGDWQLVVKANSQQLLDEVIGPETTENGWKQISVDLSGFAGRKVHLELLNQANGWEWEFAYWGRIAIVSR